MIDPFGIVSSSIDVFGYALSYAELIGTIFGFASVYLAARSKVLTWPTGIISISFIFILLLNKQLYAGAYLQVFYFVSAMIGWYKWGRINKPLKETKLTTVARINWSVSLIVNFIIFGYIGLKISDWFPDIFEVQAFYPFLDSFIMCSSIIATLLLIAKRVEAWFLWVLVDIASIILLASRGVYFLTFEYFVFLIMASYGLWSWSKKIE